MQRLTPPLDGRLSRRLDGERGATAVVLALLLVPMLGFAAIAVDIGALYADRARLQTAADAAALAVAGDCARGDCGNMQATAQDLVTANMGQAHAAPPVLGTEPTSVTVTGDAPRQHWFAPVLGHESTVVSATATVAWGSPGGGTAALPLIFSWCEFLEQTGGGLPSGTTETYIGLPKKTVTDCPGPKSGNPVPGGFGWLVTDGGGTCEATNRVAGWFSSEPGNNPSKGCSTGDFQALHNRTVLLPIFDEARGSGSGAEYHVYAYAAFTITGYHFGGQYSWNKPCKGEDRCLVGYFTRFVEPSDAFFYDTTSPGLGASVLRLIR
jgi:Flp pilus assembly protein TadG